MIYREWWGRGGRGGGNGKKKGLDRRKYKENLGVKRENEVKKKNKHQEKVRMKKETTTK